MGFACDRPHRRLVGLLALALASACAGPAPPPGEPRDIDAAVYRRARDQQLERLQREVERLQDDLRRAEEDLVAVESGLRGGLRRADAVSSLAQARIEVERATEDAPWRATEIAAARLKLEEADRQIRDANFGAALFLVYRASRIAARISEEAQLVQDEPGARFVRAERVNLRAGPSTDDPVLAVLPVGTPVFPESKTDGWVLVRTTAGPVGWVHDALLR